MNKIKRDLTVFLLEELAAQLQKIDNSQLEKLLSGKANIEIRVVQKNEENAQQSMRELPTDETVQVPKKAPSVAQVAQILNDTNTREEGERYLDNICNTKDDLIVLAKYLDLPVQKKDTIRQIRDKVIESTIGFRIRSAAIQGTSKS